MSIGEDRDAHYDGHNQDNRDQDDDEDGVGYDDDGINVCVNFSKQEFCLVTSCFLEQVISAHKYIVKTLKSTSSNLS